FVLIVPCHRVIASDGDLRGYGAGGLAVKADLLQRERAAAAKRG
ncbi:MAG: MGMT family protein, partial [Dehalococcoidia bacterium]|nr:MGMT family protein [Dehalococcoidia bacterium]